MASRGLLVVAAGAAALAAAAPPPASAAEIVLAVPGIPGPYCAYGLEKRLRELDSIAPMRIEDPSDRCKSKPPGQLEG